MNFLLRRLWFYAVAFWVAISFNFFIPRMMPGDPVDIMFAAARGRMDPAAMEAMREMYGFVTEGTLFEQYLAYLKSVLTLDLGPSVMLYPMQVTEILAMALPWTLFLAVGSLVIAIGVGVPMGTFASYNRGKKFDSIMPPLTAFVGNFPYVVTALLLFFLGGMVLKWFPLSYTAAPEIDPGLSAEYVKSVLHHAVLPMGSLVVVGVGGWLFTMRNAMTNVLGEDYITMAEAKGLSKRRVMSRYAGRNAILPVVTAISMALGFSVAGAVFTEMVFNYQGLGNLMIRAVNARDYTLVQAIMLLMTSAVLLANFVADLLYLWLDPRLRS